MTTISPLSVDPTQFRDSPDTAGIKLTTYDLTKNPKDFVLRLNNKQKNHLTSYKSIFQAGYPIMSDDELTDLANRRDTTLYDLFRDLWISEYDIPKVISTLNNLSNMNGGRYRNKTNRRRRKITHRHRRNRQSTRRRHRKH